MRMYIDLPYISDMNYKSPNKQLPTCCCPIRLCQLKGVQNGTIQKHLHIETDVQEDFAHKSISYLINQSHISEIRQIIWTGCLQINMIQSQA